MNLYLFSESSVAETDRAHDTRPTQNRALMVNCEAEVNHVAKPQSAA